MKKLTLFPLVILLFSACTQKPLQKPMPVTTCPVLFCPAASEGVLVTYVNNANTGVVVNDFHVVDLRTGQVVTAIPANGVTLSTGTYIVANYSDKMQLSTTGDSLQVSATDIVTKIPKIVGFKIAGGCTCDVSKISGPDTVKFN